MNAPATTGHFVAWLLVLGLLSVVVALSVALWKVRTGANSSAVVSAAVAAFGLTMGAALPVFQATGLL